MTNKKLSFPNLEIMGNFGHFKPFELVDIYVGTPYTESFKESGEEKHVIVWNDKNDKITCKNDKRSSIEY